jgi:hypothetical protein
MARAAMLSGKSNSSPKKNRKSQTNSAVLNPNRRRTISPDFPRIEASCSYIVLFETAELMQSANEKSFENQALDGGRTRDRTLDLSRVKGTLSR